MAFSYTGGANADGSGTSASVTHGQTINSGDLVYMAVNSNSTTAISADSGGATWNEVADFIPTSETGRMAVYWKIANGSEPSSYSATVGSAAWHIIVKVFTSSTNAEVDAALNWVRTASSYTHMQCEAVNGEVISDGAVSIVTGGKDNRDDGSPESYSDADNSYVGELGDTQGQALACAHRIFVTGLTATYDVAMEVPDSDDGISDKVYGTHISFVESAAGGGTTYKPPSGLTLLGIGL